MAVPKPAQCCFCSGSHEPDPDLRLNSNHPEAWELTLQFLCLTKAGSKASWHTARAHSAVRNSYPGYSGRSGGAAGFVLAPSPPRGHVLTISRWFQRLSSKEALAGISAHSAQAAAYAHTCSKFHSFQRVSVQGFFALSFFGKLKLSGQTQSRLLQRLREFSNRFPVAATHSRFLAITVRLWKRIKLFPSSRNYNKENCNLERKTQIAGKRTHSYLPLNTKKLLDHNWRPRDLPFTFQCISLAMFLLIISFSSDRTSKTKGSK